VTQIKTGIITTVKGDAGNSKNGAKVVLLYLEEMGYEVTAYAKPLEKESFAIECLTSLLGIKLGLPIPEPIIAITDQGEAWYATIDIGHPSLRQTIDLGNNNEVLNTESNLAILKKLSEWCDLNNAIAFDEWIANDDRHIGNVLFDGVKSFWLIDHDQAMRPRFGSGNPVKNQLLTIKMIFNESNEIEKQRLKNQIQHWINSIKLPILKDLSERLIRFNDELFQEATLLQMITFLEKRHPNIAKITSSKIKTKQLSL